MGHVAELVGIEAIDTSHLGFRPIQKIPTIHASSGFIRGIPIEASFKSFGPRKCRSIPAWGLFLPFRGWNGLLALGYVHYLAGLLTYSAAAQFPDLSKRPLTLYSGQVGRRWPHRMSCRNMAGLSKAAPARLKRGSRFAVLL